MNELDGTNPELAKPVNLGIWSSWISIISGATGAVLAYAATPNSDFLSHSLTGFCLFVVFCGCIMLFVPRVFKWDWQAKYFGVAVFHLSSFSLICIVPLFCILLYSSFPVIWKVLLLAAYTGLHVWWCSRYLFFYRQIRQEKILFGLLYCELSSGIYYMQKVDKYFIDELFKLKQMPPNIYVAICAAIGIASLIFSDQIIVFTKLPFIYVFLAIFSLPASLMCTGSATRGWLIFYFYPKKLQNDKQKFVYVDLTKLPENFHTIIRSWKSSQQR